MFLAETSINFAIRDHLSEGEVNSSHHTPEHHPGYESDNLRLLCGSEQPDQTDTIGIISQSHRGHKK